MMIDQIGIGQEATAVPLLMEIAAGEHETLREQFVRIKAIEALARLALSKPSICLANSPPGAKASPLPKLADSRRC